MIILAIPCLHAAGRYSGTPACYLDQNCRHMKKIILLRYSLLIAAALLAACEDEPTAEEKFIAAISRKWTATATGVTLDGVAVNGVFRNFSVTFTDQKTYTTTTGNAPIWAASGKFALKPASNAAGFSLVREDGVEVTVERPTDAKLILKFQYVGKPGRASSVSGRYVFDLESK